MNRKSIFLIIGAAAVVIIGCFVLGSLKYAYAPQQERYIDHEVNADADSSIGLTEIPEDGMVDETFTSHLPLIVIDTGGEEIVNYKEYNSETDAFEEPDGIDPYFQMTLSVIENDDYINTLSDEAKVETPGKIKVRGNSSSSKALPKYQYSVKLLDENGDNTDISLLNMGEDNSWILSPTVRDHSYIRNYLTFNIAGQIEPYQPDVRYCEVLFKNGDQYEYVGLYMLYETINVSEDRVDIEANTSKYNIGQGYLLKKDRFQENAVTLYTWATEQGYYTWEDNGVEKSSYFMLEYPSEENISQETVDLITEELSQIEKILYTDELRDYDKLEQLLDIGSFVDYFIINEFFSNYDAVLHSTYLYKDAAGKLAIGPYWDFDAAMDNADNSIANANAMSFIYRPWFDCLLQMEEFTEQVIARYRELRKTVLNEEYIENFIDDTLEYLGNAVLRDRDALDYYTHSISINEEEYTDIIIDRNRNTTEDEIQRVKDFLHMHGDYMDDNIEELYRFVSYSDHPGEFNTALGFCFIIGLLIIIVVVQRYQNIS